MISCVCCELNTVTVKPVLCRTRDNYIIKLLTRCLRGPGIKQAEVLCLEGGRMEEKCLEGEDGGGHGAETGRSFIFVPWLSHTLIGYSFLRASQVVRYNYVLYVLHFHCKLPVHTLFIAHLLYVHALMDLPISFTHIVLVLRAL